MPRGREGTMNAHEVRRDGEGVRRLTAGPVLDVLFVILATPALVVIGLLAEAGRLPGLGRGGTPVAETLPVWGGVVLGAWMALVAVVALVLPLVALAIWGGNADVRRALAPYVLVLICQILVEATLARVFFSNIVVIVGLSYTIYRIWRLRLVRRDFAGATVPGRYGRTVVDAILTLGLVSWSANLVFLLFVALPHVLRA